MNDIIKEVRINQDIKSTYMQTVQKSLQKENKNSVVVKKDIKKIQGKEEILEKTNINKFIKTFKSSASNIINSFRKKKSDNEYTPLDNVDE